MHTQICIFYTLYNITQCNLLFEAMIMSEVRSLHKAPLRKTSIVLFQRCENQKPLNVDPDCNLKRLNNTITLAIGGYWLHL